jgi:beta-aspartyl-peptidase (threonine type)
MLVASENGRAGILAAISLLRSGGSALDAVEVAARVSEDDPADQSVGYGGLPNILGEVELDASIMDGATLRAGAVAAVTGYGNPITLARQVMERLPHLLLVGRGAERFAAEIGAVPADQRVDATMLRWADRFARFGHTPGAGDHLIDVVTDLTRPVDLDALAPALPVASPDLPLQEPPRDDTRGTVNYLALDGAGNLASAVSTSGVAWKYPGRVGDSPLIGAGNYCDNRYGAAACTGLGELAIRVATARSLVLYLKMGMSLHDAGRECLADLRTMGESHHRVDYMNIVALSPQGEAAGFTTVPGKRYLVMTAAMDEPVLLERAMLPPAG